MDENRKSAVFFFYPLMLATIIIAALFLSAGDGVESVEVSGDAGYVLIIDAGHGGADGGALSLTGTHESEINLSISLKMQAIADLTATTCVMTRDTDEIAYPAEAKSISQKKVFDQKQRVERINDTPGAIVISVHQNKYPDGQPRGPHVFYGKTEESTELALLAQEKLTAALYPENRRVAAPVSTDIYLFKKASCTAILAECGFLSNDQEARLLEDGGHQLKAALALMSAYFQFVDTSPQLS